MSGKRGPRLFATVVRLRLNRPLKKSMRVQKMVISGVPHPLPTLEKSLVGRSEKSAFGSASFLGTFSTAC